MKMKSIHGSSPLALAVALSFAACGGSTQGTRPHDMSAASHETNAANEQTAASEHEAQYDPAAKKRIERCRAGRIAGTDVDPCWTSTTNPTAEHLNHAEQHRKAAAQHRAAAQALRDAENRACVGVPDADRDESPFDHKEDIESVEPLYVGPSGGKTSSKRLVGATVAFRAVPGMTAQWLQRVVDCHLARNAALGHEVLEMAYCPLVPKGASATVVANRASFAVNIQADTQESVQEILRRAQGLTQPSSKATP
jgi:hypothetical protein